MEVMTRDSAMSGVSLDSVVAAVFAAIAVAAKGSLAPLMDHHRAQRQHCGLTMPRPSQLVSSRSTAGGSVHSVASVAISKR